MVAASAGSAKRWVSSQRSWVSVQAFPPRQTRGVAQQELAQPMPRAGAVVDQVGAGAAQVAHGLLGWGGNADGHQLPGPGATWPAAGSPAGRS
jgi:hypothetical protein